MDGTWYVTHHDRATLIWGGGQFVRTVHIEKQNIFTLQTVPGYTTLTKYCDTVGYDPYLHDDKPDCILGNISVLSRSMVTNSATPLSLHASPP